MPLISGHQFANRCLHLCVGIGLLAICVSWRLVKLQIVDEDMNAERAEQSMTCYDTIPAQRGIIMDRNEEILTNNILSINLVADRYHLRDPQMVLWGLANNIASHDYPEWSSLNAEQRTALVRRIRQALLRQAEKKRTPQPRESPFIWQALFRQAEKKGTDNEASRGKKGVAGAREMLRNSYDEAVCEKYFSAHDKLVAEWLSPCLQMEEQEIVDKIRQDGREKKIQKIILARNLTEEKADEIMRMLNAARIRGFSCESSLKRSYAAPGSLCHVLGFVDFENEGVSGIEASFNGWLKGQNGSREYRRDAQGLILPSENDRFKEPIHGQNIRLTIDMRLQTIAEQELEKGIAQYRAPRGAVIIVEPKTGDILAMASYPSFNLNTKENQEKASLNFAVQGVYEPGSIFKVIATTAAIDSGKMKFTDSVTCDNVFVPGRAKPITCAGNAHHGTLNPSSVLKHSCNRGTCKVAFKVGWPTYKEYLERYGLTRKTGICLPTEGRVTMQNGGNLANFAPMSFGYCITVTPLHMAMVYASIANKGVRMQPRLIDKIISADGSIVDECPPQEAARVMKESTARGLREALHSVTATGGTGRRAAVPGYETGGKTGTSYKLNEGGGGYASNRYTVSFAGMVPIEDPAFVCLVVIDDPHPTDVKPGGGTVGAPIFRAVAQRVLNTLDIAPSDPAAAEKSRRTEALAQEAAKPAPVKTLKKNSRSAQPSRTGASRKTSSRSTKAP